MRVFWTLNRLAFYRDNVIYSRVVFDHCFAKKSKSICSYLVTPSRWTRTLQLRKLIDQNARSPVATRWHYILRYLTAHGHVSILFYLLLQEGKTNFSRTDLRSSPYGEGEAEAPHPRVRLNDDIRGGVVGIGVLWKSHDNKLSKQAQQVNATLTQQRV